MKSNEKYLGFIFLWFVIWTTPLQAQKNVQLSETASRQSLNLQLNIGFNTFAVGDVENLYQDILQTYRARNIPVPTQREFPGNVLLGIEVMYDIPALFNIGLASYYTWSRAFSRYEDFSGKLDVNSKVSLLALQAILQKDLVRKGSWHPFVDIRGGLAYGWLEFTEDIRFNELSELNGSSILSANGVGFVVEGYLGAKYLAMGFDISAQAGYRYGKITEPDAELKVDNQLQSSGKIALDINFSGLVVLLSVGKTL